MCQAGACVLSQPKWDGLQKHAGPCVQIDEATTEREREWFEVMTCGTKTGEHVSSFFKSFVSTSGSQKPIGASVVCAGKSRKSLAVPNLSIRQGPDGAYQITKRSPFKESRLVSGKCGAECCPSYRDW